MKRKSNPQVKICAEIAGMELILTVDCFIASSGIGAYEFWGQVGFDRGVDYVEDIDIVEMVLDDGKDTKLTKEEEDLVNNSLKKDNRLYDNLVEKASEVLMELGGDEPDYDDRGEDE